MRRSKEDAKSLAFKASKEILCLCMQSFKFTGAATKLLLERPANQFPFGMRFIEVEAFSSTNFLPRSLGPE